MQPVVIDRVAWSVGQSDCHSSLPAKTAEWPILKHRDTLPCSVQKWLNQSRYHLGCWLGWAQRITYYMGSRSPHGKGQF